MAASALFGFLDTVKLFGTSTTVNYPLPSFIKENYEFESKSKAEYFTEY